MKEILLYILVIIAIGIAITVRAYISRLNYIKRNIVDNWGKEVKGKYAEDDMKNISSYFRNKKKGKSFYIDDITWNDLSMDEIFKRINNTQSSAGEEVLYDILREPLYKGDKLKSRDEIITYFENHDKERVEMQYILAKLGKSRKGCMSNHFYTEETYPSTKLIFYRILSIIPIIMLILTIYKTYMIMFLITSIAVNGLIQYRLQKFSGQRFEEYINIPPLIKCANKIFKYDIEEIKEPFDKVRSSIKKVKSLQNKSFILTTSQSVGDAIIILDYFKMIFLIDAINFEKIQVMLVKNREDFKNIYEFVGSIDSLIAIASYRRSLKYIKPVLHEATSEDEKHLKFKELYHPLIKKPVANSCETTKSMLITGSNASGKSTFLKTVAINVLMAQTIYTCCATEFEASYFIIYSSMALKDNIFNNESYYIVEIKSLKRIMDNINDEIPCLCFVDEILRGTNTVERISASSEVLNYFGNNNCICLAATHDIELTHILNDIFDNYHFQEYVVDNEITFDYKLHSGRAETRNAIKLLKFMGYKENIVERAEQRAEDFVNTGVWKEIK